MLDVDSATAFLLNRGLIDSDWIIDGRLKIRSEARRNRNLRVEGPDGKGFLIKQPDDNEQGGDATLRAEATFHRFCRQEPQCERLTRLMPCPVDDDLTATILVFELIADAVSFQSTLEEESASGPAVAISRQLGEALGILHTSLRSETLRCDIRLAGIARPLPWVMGLHKPIPKMLATLSTANLQTLRVLQTSEGLSGRLDRLAGEWRRDTVIHGDIKFDNILIQTDRSQSQTYAARLWIVDWEMVQFGDAAWDLAGAFQDFLVLWVRSMPLDEALSSDQRMAQARVPLSDLHRTIRAMWDGYRATALLRDREADDMLRRSVSYSAARLIQTVYETLFTADELRGTPVLLLQLAANILAEPWRALVQLFGIPLRGSPS
jgi:Ser/Thr protein kinase RdoA (MazF antagonist)